MKLLPETIFGVDTDLVFAYGTPKMVKIRDARLGLLKYFVMFGIFCYVIIYQIAYKTAYLMTTPPVGTIRFSLREPTAGNCDPLSTGCDDVYPALPTLKYCSEAADLPNCPTGHYPSGNVSRCEDNCIEAKKCFGKYPCQFLDYVEDEVTFESSILVTTHEFQYEQQRTCFPGNLTCKKVFQNVKPPANFFVADVEDYTLLVDHTVRGALIESINGVSRKLKGSLYVAASHYGDKLCAENPRARTRNAGKGSLTDEAPCYIEPKPAGSSSTGDLDFFKMSTLISAAGAALDDYDGFSVNPAHSVRYNGVQLVMNIQYNNMYHWTGSSGNNIEYSYHMQKVPDSSFKLVDAQTLGAGRRIVDKRYGVRIVVLQTGTLGVYDFNTLLIQLTTSLTLLAIATVVVDSLALYVLGDRKRYQAAKFEITEDFSDLRDSRTADASDTKSSLQEPLL